MVVAARMVFTALALPRIYIFGFPLACSSLLCLRAPSLGNLRGKQHNRLEIHHTQRLTCLFGFRVRALHTR